MITPHRFALMLVTACSLMPSMLLSKELGLCVCVCLRAASRPGKEVIRRASMAQERGQAAGEGSQENFHIVSIGSAVVDPADRGKMPGRGYDPTVIAPAFQENVDRFQKQTHIFQSVRQSSCLRNGGAPPPASNAPRR